MSNEPSEEEKCQKALKEIGALVRSALPAGIGFTLLVFSFDDDGFMTYLSTAQRAGMIKAMREMIARLERETLPGGAS